VLGGNLTADKRDTCDQFMSAALINQQRSWMIVDRRYRCDRLSQSGDRRIPMAGGAIPFEQAERGTA